MPGLSTEEVLAACSNPDPSTKDFILQQTMYRIKDPKASLDFYTRVLGMRLLQKMDFPEMKFSLFFMGYENAENIPQDPKQRCEWALSRKATIELTHNWGTENDPAASYHNGNSDPRGFGHIGIMVPDVEKACERFESLGVKFVKRPQDVKKAFGHVCTLLSPTKLKEGYRRARKPSSLSKMKNIAFIQDPDGYWIEILNNKTIAGLM